jgi:glycerol-3-phosphate dehydrogenase|tara:strand:- start:4927 stop:6540 length:1614 start_codon:yes stop_codon:yes gene_type:complete
LRPSFRREESVERLGSQRFDVLVVGGGITGAGVALDAASRGLSVALIDKGDLAVGTSSRSSKMVHGGLRYLQHGEFGLVYQALAERQRLFRNASHLVSVLPFVIPILKKGGVVDRRIAFGLGLAMWQYDLTGGLRIGRRHRRLRAEEVIGHLPGIRSDIVASGYLYFDAWADDARLTLAIARTAALDHGAVVATYTALTGVTRKGGQVVGATVEADGREVQVACGAVVNACGVWADGVQAITGVDSDLEIRPAKGVHVTVPRDRLEVDLAVLLPVRGDKRSVFVLPWRDDHTYIGTTDTDHDGDLDEPLCRSEDVAYLLNAVNAMTDADLTVDDVVGTWAGLRPLVTPTDTGRTADLSRHHVVEGDGTGVVTVTGGKLTTYRRMAAEAVDAVLAHRGESRRCRTRRLRLRGAGSRADAGVQGRPGPHLAGRYGSEAGEVSALVNEDATLAEPLVHGLAYCRAEAAYAVRYEMAQTLDDVLSRRTRARLEDSAATLEAVGLVADLVGREAGWSSQRRQAEIDAFEALVAAEDEARQGS